MSEELLMLVVREKWKGCEKEVVLTADCASFFVEIVREKPCLG